MIEKSAFIRYDLGALKSQENTYRSSCSFYELISNSALHALQVPTQTGAVLVFYGSYNLRKLEAFDQLP